MYTFKCIRSSLFDDTEASMTWAWIAVPLLLVVAVPVVDHWMPAPLRIAPLLFVAPTFTVAFAGPKLTGLMGVLTLASQSVASLERHRLTREQVLLELISMAMVSALLVLFCLLRERRSRQLVRVRHVSEVAQLAVLRPLPRRSGPLLIATEYHTADPEASVGGDLFAIARGKNATRLIIGDVRGKGLDTISDTVVMLGAFRAAAHRNEPLPDLVASLDGSVSAGLVELAENAQDAGERFVTAALVDIPDDKPVIHIVSCGHPPLLLLHDRSATTLAVRRPAPPLGLGLIGEETCTPQTFPFPDGSCLLMYTDGVCEARDVNGQFYPLLEQAATHAARLAADGDDGPKALLDRITKCLLGYTAGTLNDDMAMIAVKRSSADGTAHKHVSSWKPAEKGAVPPPRRRHRGRFPDRGDRPRGCSADAGRRPGGGGGPVHSRARRAA
jgi:serine phosphatase RsbU (regulator of sigma subunit)